VGGSSTLAWLVAACGSRGPEGAKRILKYAERKNEVLLERPLFRHTSMDVPAASWHTPEPAIPQYYVSRTMPVWDPAARGVWRLGVSGLVQRPLSLTLADLMRLPSVTQRVEHFCVEGWSAIETWTGVRVSELARLAGATPAAHDVDFQSFDDGYHESWDIESAMHPQTLVCYGLDGSLLGPPHGAPARVFSPVKLGYKNTKYLTKVVFLPHRNGGYWSDQGYEWYGGT